MREALTAYLYSHNEKSLPPLLSVKNCGHAYQGQIKKDGATTALPLSPPFPPPKSSRLHSDRAGRERGHSYALTPFCSWLQLTTRPPGRAWHGSPYRGYKNSQRKERREKCKAGEEKKSPRKRKEYATFFIIKQVLLFWFSAQFFLLSLSLDQR